MAKKGRGRSTRGGSSCSTCNSSAGNVVEPVQSGGKMSVLNPESLSGGTFDSAGSALAKQAHNLYVKQNYDLASLKGQNAMMGGRSRKRGQRRGKGKSAKKYSRKSRSKSRSKY